MMENNNPNIQLTDNDQKIQSISNGTKYTQKRILIIILVVMLCCLLIPDNPIYAFFNAAIPAFLAILLQITFFSSESYKAVTAAGNTFKNFVYAIVCVILVIITAVVSWFALFWVGIYNNSYNLF